MRVLTVVFSLEKGGVERVAQNFALGYLNAGCDSRLLFTDIDGFRRKYLQEKKIHVYDLRNESTYLEIAKWDPELVHLHSHGLTYKNFFLIKKILPNAKYVETNVFSKPSPWVDHIDVSYQLSDWCRWLYQKRSYKKFHSVVLPNPIDVDAFYFVGDKKRDDFRKSIGVGENDILIGRVGQSYPAKWSEMLIDIFDRLRASDTRIKLLLVNPPELIKKRMANSLFLKDIILIDEIQEDSELCLCYSSIDIFVLIADQGESFGMVLAEALLCETPVVALATPWADNSQIEVVKNSVGGFIAANRKNIQPLIKMLIDDKELRHSLGRRGRAHIEKNYNLKDLAKKSLFIVNTNFHDKSSIKRPYSLMSQTYGSINLPSKLILKFENLFILLRFTTGYNSFTKLPFFLLTSLLIRFMNFKRKYINIKS